MLRFFGLTLTAYYERLFTKYSRESHGSGTQSKPFLYFKGRDDHQDMTHVIPRWKGGPIQLFCILQN